MEAKEETLIPELLAELGNHLKQAINQADPFCDVVFKVGSGNEQETFYAHRMILAYRCPYFRAMFSNGTSLLGVSFFSGLSESSQKEITLSGTYDNQHY